MRPLGTSGINASVIGLGTWVMGGWMWGGANDDESISAIHASIDAGVNLIDTAPVYGLGKSEEVVGKAIKGKRDKVVLATKCGLRWDRADGTFFFHSDDKGATPEESKYKIHKNLVPDSIKEEVENSLKRLQTDYIDLIQTHWQDPSTLIEDSMEMLLKLKEEGKIRAIGVSNATPDHMKQYGDIASDQEKFNMFHRKIIDQGNVEYCVENDIAFLAYSPIAQGLLTGKMSPDRTFNEGDVRKSRDLFTPENINKINTMLGEFKPIAERHNITLTQLSLAWTFNQKGITHVLCGARNAEQAIDNAKAGNVQLSKDELKTIDEVFDKYFG